MEKRLKSLEWLKTGKVILVSNRASYVLQETSQGLKGERSVGGLVSALEPLMLAGKGIWIAWGGRSGNSSSGVRIGVPIGRPQYILRELILTPEEVEDYYHVFANRILWPLCHYFLEKCTYRKEPWATYQSVNKKFAQVALEEAKGGDFIWVHDYHLSLVPQLIRNDAPSAQIGFFWHIPFPGVEIFRALPQAREILAGLLGSDLIGFHVPAYCRNFLDCVEVILNARTNKEKGVIEWEGRRVFVRSLPVGVDYEAFAGIARRPEVQARAQELRGLLGTDYVVLGVDRLDYTKGIKERLRGIELFLKKNPRYWGRFTYVQIAVPTRSEIPEYQSLRREVEEFVGRINGRFGKPGWTPIAYFYCSLPRSELVAYYLAADVLLVTPLRDGLNLVAKEYVASRLSEDGVLILSLFVGAADELSSALLVNPNDFEEISECIKYSLEISGTEKARRMRALHSVVARHDVLWWLDSFLTTWVTVNTERSLRILGTGRRGSARPLEEVRKMEECTAWNFLEATNVKKGESV